MAKRLNRLLAAIAAAATLATGVAGSAWADTADGKVDFDVKAADGTTLDGVDVGLYKVGGWNMDALERGADGTLTGIHAASADTDDRSGFTVARGGSQSAVEPHGRAAKAADSAGIDISDGTDPLDAAWALDPSDSHVKAFAEAYARELEDAKATADATVKGAGRVRLDPGVYVAMRGSDTDTAVLAGTATADGSVVRDRGDMGSATLSGEAVKASGASDAKGLSGLLGKAKRGILSLFGLDDGISVQDIGGSAGVNGYGGSGGSGLEWRWWFQDTPNRDGDAKAVAYKWGGWNTTNPARIHNDFDSTCDSAKKNAMARYGHEYGYYRIVAVGSFIGNSTVGGGKTTYHGSPGNGALRNAFWTAWNAGGKNEMQARTSDRNGYLSYVTSLADAADGGQARIACVVLGRDRPVYHFGLNLTTQAQSTDGYDASKNKWNYVDGGYDGSKHANYGGIEHDTRWVRDRIDVTATENDANFSNVVIETHLRVDENGDHKVDHEQVITEHWGSGNGTVQIGKGKTVPFWTRPFTASGLSNWGKPYWPKGHLWFDTWIKCAPGTTCGLGDKQYYHYGDGNNREEWYRTPTTLELDTKAEAESAAPTAGGTQRVRDQVVVTPRDDWWLPDDRGASEKGDYKGPLLKSWLHYTSEDGKTVKDSKMKTETIDDKALQRGGQGWAVDSSHTLHTPWFTPSDLVMASWQPGTYWFDAAVDVLNESNSPLLAKTYWDHVGKDDADEQFKVSLDEVGLTLATKASTNGATSHGLKPVRDSITLSNSSKADIKVAKATVTLNYPGGTGTKTATKTTGAVTVPAGGKVTIDSPDFAPSDLGFTNGWHANIRTNDVYWFDVKIDPANVTTTAGNKVALTSTPSHDGRTDAAEQFKLGVLDNPASTKAAGTFSTPGGNGKVHDDITLNFDEVSTLNVTSTLNWSADTNATQATQSKAKTAALPANNTTAGPEFTPADLGMTTWKAGKYWYDLMLPAQTGCPSAMTVRGLATNQAAERWTVSQPTAGITTKTDAPAGLTDLSAAPVHDTVTAKTTGYPAGSTFDATLTLNYRAADGTTAKARAVTFRAATNGSTKSPDIAPSAFSGWTKWKVGHYWFDLTAVDPNGKTVTVNGANDPNEQFDVSNHTTKATLAITTQADKGTASTTNADPVHDTVRLSATGAALTVARVHVRLNYPKADGTTATAVKDTGAVTVPANGVKSVDSPAFTPADLGLGGLWADNAKASDHYWFNVWVDKADVALSGDTGVMALSGSLSHEGRTDAAEQFRLDRQTSKATTTAAGTFARAGGTAATHDTLHLAFPGARTLKVTSTLRYAADAAAVKADASKAKTVTVAANGDVAGPSFTPSDFGWSSWKAGRYWYDLDIPAQFGYNALAVDGLTDKAEQWTAVVPFTLDLAKLAYIGQPGQGRWSNEPVKGAVFTLAETTDASGSTAKPGASPRTVTTDANGAAHLLDGVIGATGDRWFRLAETKAPASYEEPGSGTYWMVHVKGGADKAAVTVAGSNAEARGLLKGLDGSTVTVGDRLVPGAMMPMTGGRFDVARVAALAGTITLGLLIAGCWNLRRRDTDPVDR